MPNFQYAKIYKLTSPNTDKIYIGSTCQKNLSSRLVNHKTDYKRYCLGNYHYITSFEIIVKGDAKIELLETCPCNSKDELKIIEAKWIKELECVNKVIPDRTKKEYREDNKNKLKIYMKEYHEENKDKILKQRKEYYNDNKDKIKEYREKNKDKILKQKKEYREENKDKIHKKYDCPCGGKYTHQSKSIHLNTKRHKNYLSNLP